MGRPQRPPQVHRMLHVPERVLPGPVDVEVSLAERERGLCLSGRVTKLPADGERLLKMGEGFPVAHLAKREAKLVKRPRLAEPVTDLAHAVGGYPLGGH